MAGGRTHIDIGLLVLRLGIGGIFIAHGAMKLLAGPEKWAEVGHMGMAPLGITSWFAFWGFMAAFAEGVGGLFVLIGFLVRPFAVLMLFTMAVATHAMIVGKQPFDVGWSHPASMAVVFLALLITGAGNLDVVELFKTLKEK